MTVLELVLHPCATCGLQAVVMSDSDLKAASASVGILGAQPDMSQCSSANPSSTVAAPAGQYVLFIRIQ